MAVLLVFFRPPGIPESGMARTLRLDPALGLGFDGEARRFLVVSSWVRTVAWSSRGAVMLWIVGKIMRQPENAVESIASGNKKWYI